MSRRTRNSSAVVARAATAAVLLGTVGIAAAFTWGTYSFVAGYETLLAETTHDAVPETTPVIVATRTLARGTTLIADDLEIVEVGVDYVPVGALSNLEYVVGSVVQERLLVGDFVRTERLAVPGTGHGLTATIASGMRALALDLTDGELVSGFVEPGDRVDVIVTYPEHEGAPPETLTLLQSVDVLAIGTRVSQTASGEELHAPNITLAVTPEDAEKLTHASAEAHPYLVLRSEIDLSRSESEGATTSSLIGATDQRLSVAEYRERVPANRLDRMVELYHGSRRTVEPAGDTHVDTELMAAVRAR